MRVLTPRIVAPTAGDGSGIAIARRMHIEKRKQRHLTPSANGVPSAFSKLQVEARDPNNSENPEFMTFCNRPVGASSVPIELLHRIFGKFYDDLQDGLPNEKDNALALHLYATLPNFFSSDVGNEGRAHAVRTAFNDFYGWDVNAGAIDGHAYITDGHTMRNGYISVLFEAKNEIGSSTAEPFLQSSLYYQASVEQRLGIDSPMPCLIVCCFGSLLFLTLQIAI